MFRSQTVTTCRRRQSAKEAPEQVVSVGLEVRGDIAEDGGKRPDLERIVPRYRDVVLGGLVDREPQMAAGLPCNPISDLTECLRKRRA